MPLDTFEVAAGTTAGTKHRRGPLEPNQDAVLVHRSPTLVTLTVSDGLSACPNSDVAARLQVGWFTQLIHQHVVGNGEALDQDVWEYIAAAFAYRICTNAQWLPRPLDSSVADMWAATVASIVVTPDLTHFVSFGDARFLVNGELHVIEAANTSRNQPACPAYLVVPSTLDQDDLKFSVFTRPTAEIESAVVATDGLDHLIKAIGRTYPGTTEKIPGLSHLWGCDELFKQGGMDNWLHYLGRDHRKRGNVLSGGRLWDDLAIATIRRRQSTEG